MEWYVQYEQGHFATWAALRNAFLIRFRQEKTPVQLLQKLYKMKQGRKEPVDEYAGRLRTLYKRLDEDSKPTRTMLIGWFVAGLRREYRGIISLNAQDLNSLDEAVELASRVERNTRKQKKGAKKYKDESSSSSSQSESEGSSSSSSENDGGKRAKRKTKAKVKNVEALMTKLTTGGSTSTYRPGVYCPRCSNEGHTKEECKMNDRYCAICVTTNNHTTENCRFNGARRRVPVEAPVLQVQAQPHVAAVVAQGPNPMNAVPPPRTYGRGRLPDGICWYCRQPGHRKPDCQLWKRHRSELEDVAPQEQIGPQANINMVSITPLNDVEEVDGYAVTRSQGRVKECPRPKAKNTVTWEDHDVIRRETVRRLQEEQGTASGSRTKEQVTQEGGNKDWNENQMNGLGMPGIEFPQDKGKAKVAAVEELSPCVTALMYKNLRDAEDGERNSSDVRRNEQKSDPADLRDAEDVELQGPNIRKIEQKSDPADLREAEDVEPQSSSVKQTKQKG